MSDPVQQALDEMERARWEMDVATKAYREAWLKHTRLAYEQDAIDAARSEAEEAD